MASIVVFAKYVFEYLMNNSKGFPTNALYGFVNMIQHVISTYEFSHIFVAFDKGKKTLRHQSYSDYKAGRAKTPEEFLMQIPYIKEYLDELNNQTQSQNLNQQKNNKITGV